MISKPFFQQLKIKTALISVVLTSTPVSAIAAQTVQSDPSIPLAPVLAQSAVVYPTLRIGSTGETVSRLQATLKLLGFYQGSVDGNYSQLTEQAVISFQTAANLTADGITGPATWSALLPTTDDVEATIASGEGSPDPEPTESVSPEPAQPEPTQSETTAETPSQAPPVLRPSAEGTAVSQLQRELQTLGYYDSVIDGKYGDLTEAAVRQFQSDQQLVVDAVVGPSTWEALSRALED